MHKNGRPAPVAPANGPRALLPGSSDCDKDGIPDSIDACPDQAGREVR